ncbi:MAG: RNA polymerase sigma factor [Deltaproteobacteria bacterium]|nr:RNA polymerase sigma factor [Deltaproteobacteria bacterium]
MLKAFREGRREALERVYRYYVDDIYRLLRRGFVVGGSSDAYLPPIRDSSELDDVLQEVFVRAFAPRARHAYDGINPFRPYLRRIAKNYLIDRFRRGAHRELPASTFGTDQPLDIDQLIDADAPIADAPLTSEEQVAWQRDIGRVHEFLKTVDAQMARYVRLRFVDELPQRQIAAAMDVTRRRVRTLDRRLKQEFLRFLAYADRQATAKAR